MNILDFFFWFSGGSAPVVTPNVLRFTNEAISLPKFSGGAIAVSTFAAEACALPSFASEQVVD